MILSLIPWMNWKNGWISGEWKVTQVSQDAKGTQVPQIS